MADPYGYDRPTLVDLTDNVNTFRRKVNQIGDDLGDKRRLLTDPGTSLASDSDIVGNLIELDYRLNQTSDDLYLRADGGSLYIQNGNTGTIAAEFLYDSAAGNISLITPMSGDFTIDTVGDIVLDADGNDIRFKNGGGGDEVIHTLANDANYTITAPANYTVDAVGDIILDADGNDIIFKNGAGADTVTHTLSDGANYTVTAPNDVVIDAVGNITLDADANNIVFRDGSQPRVQYTLGTDNLEYWSGNLVRDVSGSLKDSAGTSIIHVSGTSTTHTVGTNYALTAGGNYTVDVDGSMKDSAGTSYTLVAGTTIDQVSGGNFTTTVTGDVLVDASGDITLDADGNDIFFRDGNALRLQFNLGSNNNENWTGNLIRNVSGSIIDSAGTSIQTVSTTTTTHTVGTDYALTAGGNYAVDVDGSISDSAGTFISRTAGTNISDVAYTGSYTLDAATSIKDSAGTTYTVVAGTNISQTSTTGSTTHVSGTTTTHTVGTNYNLTAGGNSVVNITGSIDEDAGTTIDRTAGTNITDTATAGSYTLNTGTTLEQTAGSSITQTSTTTFNQVSGGNFTTTVTGDVLVDASGDIILDADGNDIIFKNGAGLDTVTHTLSDGANYTITAPNNYTIDAVADITLDAAGDNIIFKDDGTTRITYTLGATTDIAMAGSLTTNVGGSIFDSAGTSIQTVSGTTTTHTVGTNYALTAGGNYTVDVDGSIADSANSISRVSTTTTTDTVGTDYTLTVGGTSSISSVGNYTLDVEGDIIFDAADSDVFFKRAGTTFGQFQMGAQGNVNTLEMDVPQGDLYFDVTGDIVLDADGNDIIFKNGAGGDTVTHTLADSANYTITAPNDVVIDAVGNITLDADANNIIFRNGAGGDQVTHSLADDANYTITAPNNYTVDAVTDITLDAAGNDIYFKDGAQTRVQYNLGGNNSESWTGNLTRNISGSLVDSAGASIYQVAGTTFNQVSGGNFTTTVTGDVLVDASGDITLDAAGQQINFVDATNTRMVFNLDATPQIDVTGNYTVSGSGSILQSSTTTQELTGTDITLDASNNIYLEADGDQIHLRAITANKFIFGVGASPTLDITGNYTETGSGFLYTKAGTYLKDSAATTSTLTANSTITRTSINSTITDVAKTNISQTATTGSYSQSSGTTFTQTAGTNFTTNVTGNYLNDVGGDYTNNIDGYIIDSAGTYIVSVAAQSITRTSGTSTTDNVGTSYTLDADSAISQTAGWEFTQTSGTTFDQVSGGNFTTTVTGDFTVDASGIIVLDTESDTVTFKDGAAGHSVTHVFTPANGDYTVSAPRDYTLDIAGDITLDADGGDIFFKDAGTTNYQFATDGTISRTGDVALDVTGDITLDAAGDNIVFADAGSTRVTYTLGATTDMALTGSLTHTIGGDYTENVTGSTERNANAILDSSDTTYTVVAKTSVSQTSGTTFTQTSGGNFTTNVTGAYLVDASGDITLDADGGNWFFQDNAVTQFEFLSGTNKEIDIPSGNLTIDVAGDINLDADGGDILLKDGGTEFGRLSNSAGSLQIYSPQSDKDINFVGNDGGATFTALSLDMSDSGSAIFSHDIYLPDNGRAVFGASSDLQIYHDGSASYIDDVGTGNLFVRADSLQLRRADGSQIYLAANTGAEVALYHAGNAKLSTTSTGIDVTGTVVSNGFTLENNAEYLSVKNSSGTSTRAFGVNGANNLYIGGIDADIGPILFVDNGATLATLGPTGLDVNGTVTADGLTVEQSTTDALVNFKNTNASTSTQTSSGLALYHNGGTGYAKIVSKEIDVSDNFADLQFYYAGGAGGAPKLGMQIASNGDISFYDSVAAVQNFYWDASTSRLGLGTTSPNGLLETKSTGDNFTYLRSGDANTVGIIFGNQSDAATASIQMLHSDNSLSIRGYNNTERARVDASGNFLVGTTDINPSQNAVEGIALSAGSYGGYFSAARSGGVVAQLARLTNDGAILDFRNASVSVGTIGVADGDLNIYSSAASHGGLRFGNGWVAPTDNAGTLSNGTIDLGLSSGRFENLWLTGRISAGGVSATGSNGIWVDSATGNVGIGVASPASPLHISSAADTVVTIGTTNATADGRINFRNSAGTDAGRIWYNTSGNRMMFYTDSTERMRISNAGNVGIGTDNPVNSTNYKTLHISGDSGGQLLLGTSTSSYETYIYNQPSGTVLGAFTGKSLQFHSDGGEKARIDTAGNLLVGKTSSSNAQTTVGHLFLPDGRHYATASGGVSGIFSRTSSDGDILSFYKDGAAVGSIGTFAGDLTIGDDDIGIRFDTGTGLVPWDLGANATGGLARDAAIDIGASSARFKDLHLSGTAYLPLVDIDGGSIDGATLGANSAIVAGTFTDLTVTDTLNLPTTISPTSIVFNDAVQEVNLGFKGGVRYSNSMTFGNDSDLTIYHDGSNSYIKDKGDGDLRLTTTTLRVRNNADTANQIVAVEGGAVTLYHNGNSKLVTTSTGVTVTGLLTADTKSFTIDHPTKEGMKLRYGSLEGPEHGVYVRGRLNGENTIELPEVWLGLVDENTITVNLTPIGKGECWVEDIQNNTVTVGGHLNCFYMVLAERKDVEKLEVEFPSDGS